MSANRLVQLPEEDDEDDDIVETAAPRRDSQDDTRTNMRALVFDPDKERLIDLSRKVEKLRDSCLAISNDVSLVKTRIVATRESIKVNKAAVAKELKWMTRVAVGAFGALLLAMWWAFTTAVDYQLHRGHGG